ncbi:class I SAM-dependent methyltransferase [Stackebrandtia nassauensis]|uniref:Cyclopropane-fatty-acyl-phospholipid synthase n=1 Tax=Stackebrandtia nassauensis (strain DSM 44728 / CIP 108903 / NRRL B-16338 / NBRC 102104 / LLR-40K-21) TaxID=446470 RepID=D3Q9U7_STANL|nr:Cyclopropane-fatty-acyl-phospholipid synthase [Stackebrandtia nassauensis DSM 44728]
MQLAEVFTRIVGNDPPVGFRAYDGSAIPAGPDAPVLDVRDQTALNYLASARRFELGLARAYITGAVDVAGDLYELMKKLWMLEVQLPKLELVKLWSALGGLKLLKRPPIPAREAHLSGRSHSKSRDADAISHHYDVGNDFYELFLGDSMAYTCAVYESHDTTLEQAQWAKHDLVARKLDLKPGMRLLDVGCGWGGMVRHAAKHYGVKALGVTLSKEQAEWAQKAIVDQGLQDLAEVKFLDYRDVPDDEYDVISSIGLTEHIGRENLASYFSSLYSKLKVGGRLLNHCITKPDSKGPAIARGGFIERYIFPDGALSGPGPLMTHMHDAGFEVQHAENLREHYALTLAAWEANLERNWDDAVKLVGLETARTWRLYLVGCRLGFEHNGIQLHQMLGVKLGDQLLPAMPLRPTWTS